MKKKESAIDKAIHAVVRDRNLALIEKAEVAAELLEMRRKKDGKEDDKDAA